MAEPASCAFACDIRLIVAGLARNKFEYADTLGDILGPPGAVIVNVLVVLDTAGAICVVMSRALKISQFPTQFKM